MKEKEKTTLRKIEYHKKESIYLIVRGIEVGIAAGLISVFYRFILTNAEALLLKAADFAKESTLKGIIWFAILALMGLCVAKIIQWEPMSAGSGTP